MPIEIWRVLEKDVRTLRVLEELVEEVKRGIASSVHRLPLSE